MDEAAFIPLAMFFEVIVPLIGMKDARLFMITTPVDQYNFFSKLVKRKDPRTGKFIFDFEHVQLACKRCINSGRTKMCKHRMDKLPPWKDEDSMSLIREIMKDHQALFERENIGMIAESGDALIPPRIREKWMMAPRFDPEPTTLTSPMFVTVMDPNGGDSANASEMSIVSIAFLADRLVVRLLCRLALFCVYCVPESPWLPYARLSSSLSLSVSEGAWVSMGGAGGRRRCGV